MDNLIGKTLLNRYYITEKIGAGGMANVYKARCSVLNRYVAIKILKEEYRLQEEFVNRFKAEARAVALLSQPNIVSIFDIGVHDDLPMIVMELIEGITLKEYIKQKGRLSWRDAVFFSTQILRALEHAHSRKIIHRDIKPQNIMLLPDGTIKVADFGIARFAVSNTQTLSDSAMGTVHYLSPEQAKGGITDARSDIYSVGVVMYEMLTGKVPFDADNPVSVALMHLQSDPVPPSQLNGTIPPGLESIIMKAMRRDVNERYQSATQMLNDLDAFRKNPNIKFEYVYNTETQPTVAITPVKPENINTNFGGETRIAESSRIQHQGGSEIQRRHTEPAKNDSVPVAKIVLRILAIIACCVLVFFAVKTVVTVVGNLMSTGNFTTEKPVEEIVIESFVGKDYEELIDDEKYKDKLIFVKDKLEYDEEIPEGKVISQTPAEGRTVKEGATVKLVVSLGKEIKEVPSFEDTEFRIAKIALEKLDLDLDIKRIDETNDKIIQGYVIRTDPEAGTVLERGDTVKIYVSLGKEMVTMPELVGKTVEEARKTLAEAGIEMVILGSKQSEYPESTVAEQSVKAGTQVDKGSSVSIYVSEGMQTTMEHYIKFPLTPESFELIVKVNDIEVYKGNHTAEEGSMVLPVSGTSGSSAYIEVFVDGKLHASQIIYFD